MYRSVQAQPAGASFTACVFVASECWTACCKRAVLVIFHISYQELLLADTIHMHMCVGTHVHTDFNGNGLITSIYQPTNAHIISHKTLLKTL